MEYESIKILGTWINYAVLTVGVSVTFMAAKDGLEGHINGEPLRDTFKKMKKRIVGGIIGVIAASYAGFVKGYF